MRFYLFTNNEVRGPFTVSQLRSMWKSGSVTELDSYCEEGTEDWLPLSYLSEILDNQSISSASPAPPAETQRKCDETLGNVALFLPILGTLLAWFWVGRISIIQGPAGILGLISVIVVVGTGLLISVEATKLGIGTKSDPRVRQGKKVTGPVGWGIFVIFLWIIGFPLYMWFRSKFGLKNLAIGATLIAVLFVSVLFTMQNAVENIDSTLHEPASIQRQAEVSDELIETEDSAYQKKIEILNDSATKRANEKLDAGLSTLPPELLFEMYSRNTDWKSRDVQQIRFLERIEKTLVFEVTWIKSGVLTTEKVELLIAPVK